MTGGPYNALVYIGALFIGIMMVGLVWIARKKRPRSIMPSNGVEKITAVIFLACTVVHAFSNVFLFFTGETKTLLATIITASSLFMPIYAMAIIVYLTKEKDNGLDFINLIPVVSVMLYMVFSFVGTTEMATLQHYILEVLSSCALLFFFFTAAKGMFKGASLRKAGILAFLSAIYLTAQSVAYPLYVVTNSTGTLTWGTILSSYVLCWGLIVFLAGFGSYLYDR